MKFTAWFKPFERTKDVRGFLIAVTVVVTVFVSGLFLFRYFAVNRLLLQSLKQEAQSFAQLIVLTRHWNAQYGGVYVVKRPGVESNPYLKELGIDPDIRSAEGRTLTLRNPAIMTREISQLAQKENIARFHMISLKNLNPENRPDDFERNALERFERGEREVWTIEDNPGSAVFRYVQPLIVEASCLNCHRQQGYALGAVRGGISVITPAEGFLGQMRTNRSQIIISSIMTIGILLAILYFLSWKLAIRLDEVQTRLRRIAVTDDLTGLKNRRYIMTHLDKEYQRAVRTGAPLSVIVIDIDHFKKVNDTYGHAFGDLVLKAVSREMEGSLRSYDLLGRIGGEEFIVASPGSTLDDAAGLAERIRDRIRNTVVANGAQETAVTVSAGVTSLSEQDAKADNLLARADSALYLAKQGGRDRVIAL
jgi:diguanylate cyclase (GGDEF)-like protein